LIVWSQFECCITCLRCKIGKLCFLYPSRSEGRIVYTSVVIFYPHCFSWICYKLWIMWGCHNEHGVRLPLWVL
jgi:hypothetical protein